MVKTMAGAVRPLLCCQRRARQYPVPTLAGSDDLAEPPLVHPLVDPTADPPRLAMPLCWHFYTGAGPDTATVRLSSVALEKSHCRSSWVLTLPLPSSASSIAGRRPGAFVTKSSAGSTTTARS